MLYYRHHLPFQGTIQQLLAQLSTQMEGVIYLQDDQSPSIAFLPEDYWYVNEDNTTAYLHYVKRSDNFNYQQQLTMLSTNDDIEQICAWQQFDQASSELKPVELTQGFSGGYVGFVGYDYAAQQFLQQLHFPKDYSTIKMYIGQYRHFIREHQQQFYLYSLVNEEVEHQRVVDWVQQHILPQQTQPTLVLQSPLQARWHKQAYDHAFRRVQAYIVAGDCYQINLTQEFTGRATGCLLAAAEVLWQATQAPFSGYLKFKQFELLSCSPELFIEWQTATHIKTRPIKGTMARHENPEIDQQNKHALQHSSKDRAENVMIVDLLRNDFGLYAETGSVKTTQLFEVESFNQVHHLVSEIQATLHPNVHAWRVLLEALPGGSITGAPKIRAMQIIDEIEQGSRNAYCGSLGYFNFTGQGRWNILIRSVQKYHDAVSVWAGGGVTIASQSDAEYQECFDKIQKILQILNQFD